MNKKVMGLILFILLFITATVFSYPSIQESLKHSIKWFEDNVISWIKPKDQSAKAFKVHPWLALHAIELFENTSPYVKLDDEIKKQIIAGSIEEDYDVMGTSNDPVMRKIEIGQDDPLSQSLRCLNHFMDKDYKGLVAGSASAYDWANDNQFNLTNYSHAKEALASGDIKGWRYLGHVLHLLQDMSVPAHVRNDQHLLYDGYEHTLNDVGTDQTTIWIDGDTACSPAKSYNDLMDTYPNKPTTKSDIKSFFYELSDYTRNNYFSDDTVDKNKLTTSGCEPGYCCTVNGTQYKQGIAYYVTGNDCGSVKVDGRAVTKMFPDLSSKAIAYGAGLIQLFYEETKSATNPNPNPVYPKGYIQGAVRDGCTLAPIAGAVVDIGIAKATTDSNGQYILRSVPATSYTNGKYIANYGASVNMTNAYISGIKVTGYKSSYSYKTSVTFATLEPSSGITSTDNVDVTPVFGLGNGDFDFLPRQIGYEYSCNGTMPPTSSCPSGNGLYCGSSVGLTFDVLYSCKNGVYTQSQTCTYGCKVNAPGVNDNCKDASTAGSCPSNNGLYCGNAGLGQDTSSLYQCNNGTYTLSKQCSNGCQINAAGTNDSCRGISNCPSGNGLYCGSSVNLSSNVLYNCNNGVYTQSQTCDYGCQVNAAGTNDSCKAGASCPSGNGLYCGSSVGLTLNVLYNCKNGVYTKSKTCTNGCQVNAAGDDDKCKSTTTSSCPSGNGYYCGISVGRTPNALYYCKNGEYTKSKTCSNGCKVNSAGTNDACR